MNNVFKVLVGLVTTGTAIAGAFLANSYLNKEEKKVDSEIPKIDGEKKNKSRTSALATLLKGVEADVRKEIINIIAGEERDHNPVFDTNSEGSFFLEGDVATAIGDGCSGDRDGEKEKLAKRTELKKQEICDL